MRDFPCEIVSEVPLKRKAMSQLLREGEREAKQQQQ